MSSGTVHATPSDDHGGRASKPGRRWAFVAAAVLALAVAAVLVIALKPSSSSGTINIDGRNLPLTKKLGHPASWIKIPRAPAVKIAKATAAAPQLHAMEGYPVQAVLPHGSVQISVAGPSVPTWATNDATQGKWPAGATAPATFDVTFTSAKGTVPLSPADFSIITYSGELLQPKIADAAGGRLPTSVAPGKSVTLKLSSSVPQGDGEVRWGPINKKILVAYFWTLELD
jgi:hypothetical protein